MDKNTGKITIQNAEGVAIECDILFTFDDDNLKKSYIVFTDNTVDENGNTKVYANTYDPSGETDNLGEITDEKEWQIIENLLTSLQEKVGEEKDEEEKA